MICVNGNSTDKRIADKCSCGNAAVIFLHYTNRALCEKHFIEMFDRRVGRIVREFSMLKKGDRVVVGVSGGKDSCVLLHSLVELNMPVELIAVTIDEGIKGYREKTLKTAKKECEKLGIEHKIYSFKDAAGKTMDQIIKEKKEIPCSYCGVIRRYMLNKAAKDLGANKLAIGHNLDDIGQTLLMNIMRNEPLRIGRGSVDNNEFVKRIRPLMKTPEKEVAIYAMLKKIELDRKDCPYAHFAFRSHVRKLLNETEEKYPGTKFKVANSYFEMEKTIGKNCTGKIEKCNECGQPCSENICMFCKMKNDLLV